MTKEEKIVWINTFLAMSVATIEIGMMVKDGLVMEEKQSLNRMTDKFRVMLRSFDSAVEENASFQQLVTEYSIFTEKAVKLQLEAFKDEEQ